MFHLDILLPLFGFVTACFSQICLAHKDYRYKANNFTIATLLPTDSGSGCCPTVLWLLTWSQLEPGSDWKSSCLRGKKASCPLFPLSSHRHNLPLQSHQQVDSRNNAMSEAPLCGLDIVSSSNATAFSNICIPPADLCWLMFTFTFLVGILPSSTPNSFSFDKGTSDQA